MSNTNIGPEKDNGPKVDKNKPYKRKKEIWDIVEGKRDKKIWSIVEKLWNGPNKEKIKKIIEDPNVVLRYLASDSFIELLKLNINPIAKRMPAAFKLLVINKLPIPLDSNIVIRYLDSLLDSFNTCVLDHGEIIVDFKSNLVSDGVSSETKNLKDIILKN